MNTYLIVIWDPAQDPAKVIYLRVLEAATAADAKNAAKIWEDERPAYRADTIKMS